MSRPIKRELGYTPLHKQGIQAGACTHRRAGANQVMKNKMGHSRIQSILIGVFSLLMLLTTANAVAAEGIVYYHTDALGSVVAATDEQGDVLWREAYQPFGTRMEGQVSSADNTPLFAGKPHDDAIGLSYFGARYYDPEIGRFMGIDPVGVDPADFHSFNRYAYANNNPYRYVDPDGRSSTLAALQRGVTLNEAVEQGDPVRGAGFTVGVSVFAVGMAIDTVSDVAVPVKGLVKLGIKKFATKRGTETVQRAMSRGELEAIQNSGVLSRGGRAGPHYVSDAVNSTASRARQRLALPGTPEVRVTMDVPKGVFSSSSKVNPKFNMPGGGMERIAPGHLDIPAEIRRVDGL